MNTTTSAMLLHSNPCNMSYFAYWYVKSRSCWTLSYIFSFSECEVGWFELRPYGCYALKDSQKTWNQWKQGCDEEDAVLATFETETEYNALEQYMESNEGQLSSCTRFTVWCVLMWFGDIRYHPCHCVFLLKYFTGTEEIMRLPQCQWSTRVECR